MESQKETLRKDQEAPDILTSIFAGGLICLAFYGAYKLLHNEKKPQPVIAPPSDSGILDRLLEQELGR